MNCTRTLLRSLMHFAAMVEARDPYTGGHLWRVSQFAHLLAAEADFDDQQQARIALGGFLHDLGKIGVPDGILNKAGPLNEEEFAIIKTHPEIGHRLLSQHPLAPLVDLAVHAHHERPDGSGYPQGLKGEAIPLVARVVGIADAFDAMTSMRSYRAGMPIAQALEVIRDNLGTQFDARLGEHFLALGEASYLEHVVGHSEPGIPLQTCPECGPIIVVMSRHGHGDLLYCPLCAAELALQRDDGKLSMTPTGHRGTPSQLAPEVDGDLIARLVQTAERLLSTPLRAGLLSRLRTRFAF
ncbi:MULTISPECIES: HD-GYP domain-containing protein [unclassified Halomonas]|uniref:HD-GYP domain-containing protein n=1 Tax=unclassified Halomonas TaxID=2609666 RepID=UPI002469773B|nr:MULTISPECIES: HD-GYP domain-containing protein [unclassified Halomonas]